MSTLPNIDQHRELLVETYEQLFAGLITVTEAVFKVYSPGGYHIEQIRPGRMFFNRTLKNLDTGIEYFDTIEVGLEDKEKGVTYVKCNREERPPLPVIGGDDDDSFPR